MAWRRSYHFRADRDYVEGLYDHPGRTVGNNDPGALLTPDEYAEYRVRRDLESDMDIIDGYYEAHTEARADFGGVMLDHAAGGVVAVYLLASAPTPWLGELRHPGRFVTRDATASLDELRARKAELSEAWSADAPGTGKITGLGIDVEHNAVAVYFDPTTLSGLAPGALPAGFADRFGTSHLYAKAASPSEGGSTLKGGWSWDDDTSGYKCLFAFTVNHPDYPGHDYMLSAGHCTYTLPDDQTVYHNYGSATGAVGKLKDDAFYNGASKDASVFRIDFSGGSWDSLAKVVRGHDGTDPYLLPVTGGVQTNNTGQARCHTGKSDVHPYAITVCGVITDPDYEATYTNFGGYHIHHLVVVGDDDDPSLGGAGDSGGPVFSDVGPGDSHAVYAAGVYGGQGLSGDYWFYTPMAAARVINGVTYTRRDSTDPECYWPDQHTSPECPSDTSGDY
jgi:hypothetical protein